MKLKTVIVASALLLGSQQAYAENVSVKSGVRTPIQNFYIFFKRGCKIGPFAKASISNAKHGRISVVNSKQRITSGKCAGKTLNVTTILYQSNPGYRGKDNGAVSLRFAAYAGEYVMSSRTIRFNISVN